MDILAWLPDTPAGQHTAWLWSQVLAMARGASPPGEEELAEHFAPSVFEQMTGEQLVAHFTPLAATLLLVERLIEEASSRQRYSALLGLPDLWLRYTCLADDERGLLIAAYFSHAVDPNSYSNRRVERDGRDVQIRDFGGTGPPMLLWHGAGGELADWETLVSHLAGVHVIAQDLPGHGRSPLQTFTAADTLADADAVVAELDQGPPAVVGVSLGGYLGLRYAASRRCAGWIGMDGPFALAYPWDLDEPGFSEAALQVGCEIRAIDVVRELTTITCPAMLLLCAVAASEIEQRIVPGRRELAEHIARHHPEIRIEWIQTGHDMILFEEPQATARIIRDWCCQFDRG